MGAFVKEVMEAQEVAELPNDIDDNKKKTIRSEFELLRALKEMFARMRLSKRKLLDPTPVLRNLVNWMGDKIAYGDQKDLHEINLEIVDRLNECLLYTQKANVNISSVKTGLKKENIKGLFYGEKIEEIEGRNEFNKVDFMGLILNLKDEFMFSALDAELNYNVEVNGKNMKRCGSITVLPTYLSFTINLADYEKDVKELIKNENKLEFEFEISMDYYLYKSKLSNKPEVQKLYTDKY
jgi:hypothetical protein